MDTDLVRQRRLQKRAVHGVLGQETTRRESGRGVVQWVQAREDSWAV